MRAGAEARPVVAGEDPEPSRTHQLDRLPQEPPSRPFDSQPTGSYAERMRVLVLAPQPLAQTRGTPIAVKALIEALSSRGYGLEVLTYAESEDFDVPNCVIRHIPRIPGLRRPRPGF